MATIRIFALLAAGLLLIIKGGDIFVDASIRIAERTRIPRIILGATLVSLATTLPEMLVSLLACLQGKIDMSAGNAVGSATANVGLILAISILAAPQKVHYRDFAPKGILLLFSAALLFAATRRASLSILQSVLLLFLPAAFLYQNIKSARCHSTADADAELSANASSLPFLIFLFLAGAAGIAVGAQLLVDNGSALAALAGVPDGVIGATLIAIGTSLPELVTMITALRRGESALSVGNILGANIIDLTLILPLCSLISRRALPLSSRNAFLDIPFGLMLTCIAIVPTLLSGRFRRVQGVILLTVYAAYAALLIL